MKRISIYCLVFTLAFLFSGCGTKWKLPPPSQVEKDYRKEYRKVKKEQGKKERLLSKEGFDIILDPIETTPIQQSRSLESGNWGERLLLPNDLRDRIAGECVHKVLIKVFDTGGDSNHPDLQRGKIQGSNYTSSTTLDDLHGHATHVAGIAVAAEFGLAYDLIDAGLLRFKFVKILGDSGSGSFSWISNAIKSEDNQNTQYIDNGWSVICNGSFGGGSSIVESVESALKESTDKGVIYAFAAGNNGRSVNYPGLSKYSITCAALKDNLERAVFSGQGKSVDFAYPGQAIVSTYKNGSYATLSGTSMSTPFLTAAIAIAKSRWGDALPNYKAIEDYFAKIATDIDPDGKDDQTGHGIAFIEAILDTNPRGDGGGGEDPAIKNGLEFTFDNFSMRYRNKSSNQYKSLIIPSVTITVQNTGSPSSIHDNFKVWVERYFYNRAIILPDGSSGFDATYWSGRFMEVIAAQNELTLDIVKISGITPEKRQYWSSVPEQDQEGEFDAKIVNIGQGFEEDALR